MGIVRNLDRVPLTGVVAPADDIWLVGPAVGALGGSHLDDLLGVDHGGDLPAIDPSAVDRHHSMAAAIAAGLVRSAHDLSEGGLAVAAAEWAFAGRMGLALDVETSPEVLFGEGPGRYLVEVAAEDEASFAAAIPEAVKIGVTLDQPIVVLGDLEIDLERIGAAWKGVSA